MAGKETIIRFPDLIALTPFSLHVNPATAAVSSESDAWLIEMVNFADKPCQTLISLNAGSFCGMSYTHCSHDKLRVCTDFVNWICTLDDETDELNRTDTKGMTDSIMNVFHHPYGEHPDTIAVKPIKSTWLRMLPTMGPRCRQRFICAMDWFFQAIQQQATDRAQAHIPEVEHYMVMRRDTSACKALFALIEYAYDLDLPNEVAEHPVMISMQDASNDILSWTNDILSYNGEQARGDQHNLVSSIMHTKGVDPQTAVDYCGKLVKDAVERFLSCKAALPSWGEDIDKAVAIFVQGYEDLMIGNLMWSFESERYFGREGAKVKEILQVALLPQHSRC